MSIPISKEQWSTIKPYFDQLLDLPEADQFTALEALPLSSALKKELVALLKAHHQQSGMLDQPAANFLNLFPSNVTTDQNLLEPAPLPQIGRYECTEVLGRGGMGSVYLAKRKYVEFEQLVAVKVLANSHNNTQLMQRFQLEQSTLARLEHPNIARIYDSGVTEQGDAYFVMEYVEGLPLDQYCSQKSLNLKQRLEIIAKIARVISYAHQRLIVHRDIKPSNILVKPCGTIKLLDFGIVKLLDSAASRNVTIDSGQPLTPGFSSPEQLLNKEITVGTDVYLLGLVCYELLTSKPAFDPRNKSLAEIIKAVCEEEPPRPSAVTRSNQLQEPEILERLSGDVDALVLKAIQTDPKQRYTSMADFSEDIENYFNHRPLTARRGAAHYVVKKFIRRHWRPLIAATLFLTTSIGYFVFSAYQANQIKKAYAQSALEAEKAKRVSDLLISVFNAADPNQTGLEGVTAKQLLIDGESRIIEGLKKTPEIQSHMLNVLAEIWEKQGEYERMIPLLESALKSPHQRQGVNDSNLRTRLGIAYYSIGEYIKSKEIISKTIENLEANNSDNSQEFLEAYAQALLYYGVVVSSLGDNEYAEKFVLKAKSILDGVGDNNHHLGVAYFELGAALHMKGNLRQAMAHYETSAEYHRLAHGSDHIIYARMLNNLSALHRDMEDYVQAEKFAFESLSIQKALLGEDNSLLAPVYRSLAVIQYRMGKLDKAKRYIDIAVSLQKGKGIQNDEMLLSAIRNAEILIDLMQFKEAVEILNPHVEWLTRQTQRSDLLGKALAIQAEAQIHQNNLEDANRLIQRSLMYMTDGGILKTKAQLLYAVFFLKVQQWQAAVEWSTLAFQQRVKALDEDHAWLLEAAAIQAIAMCSNGEYIKAHKLHKNLPAKLKKHLWFSFGVRENLSKHLQVTCKFEAINFKSR